MRFLVGISAKDKKAKAAFPKNLKQFLRNESKEITMAYDWLSALGYVAIDEYSAIWMDWDLLKSYYLKFHQKLFKLNHYLPLIIFSKDSQIDERVCIQNNLLFSILPLDQISEKGEDLIHRLKRYDQLLSEIPKEMKSHLRPNGFGPFIGNSLLMLETYHQIMKVASTDFTVLILGESGSGKELVAKTIHELSSRKNHPFISLNCAAIPENLLESELFGYEKGAFTGANHPKAGKFELGDQGTVFLDEIGDMAPNLQAKLLRVLEDHSVERLGGTIPKKVNIRLLAATNQDMSDLIKKGKFRSDLHFRLNVIPIKLSSITNRNDDILLLTLHILGKLTEKNPESLKPITFSFINALQGMEMSGNVRELENLLTRVIFQSSGSVLGRKTLQDVLSISDFKPATDADLELSENVVQPLWQVEKQTIQNALSKLNGNISRVATQLEISRTALYRKIKKYQIK